MKTEVRVIACLLTDFLLQLSLIRLGLSPSNAKAVKGYVFKTRVSVQMDWYNTSLKMAIHIHSEQQCKMG